MVSLLKSLVAGQSKRPSIFPITKKYYPNYNVIIDLKKWSLNSYILLIIFKKANLTSIRKSPAEFVNDYLKEELKQFSKRFNIRMYVEAPTIDCKDKKDLYVSIPIEEEDIDKFLEKAIYLEKFVGEAIGLWEEGLIV